MKRTSLIAAGLGFTVALATLPLPAIAAGLEARGGANVGAGADVGAPGMDAGANASTRMNSEGMTNTNDQNLPDATRGTARSEERMSTEAQTHSRAAKHHRKTKHERQEKQHEKQYEKQHEKQEK